MHLPAASLSFFGCAFDGTSDMAASFGRYDRSRDRSIESIGSVGSVLRSDRHETSGKRVSDDLQLSIF